MELTIKPAAAEIWKNKVAENQVMFLALNDGSTKYSKIGGTCTIGANFQFVVSDVLDPDYNIPVENNAGFTIYTAEPETTFLGDGLTLDGRWAMLSLKDNGGIIDGGVTISKNELVGVTASDMKELGGKIC